MLSVVNLWLYSSYTVIEYFDWLVQQMLVCSVLWQMCTLCSLNLTVELVKMGSYYPRSLLFYWWHSA